MNNPAPPKYLLRFFRWFCKTELHQFIEGDLLELYQEKVKTAGKRRANWFFMINILLLLRRDIIRPVTLISSMTNSSIMWKNYYKIGFRNLVKHRFYSVINIVGMTIGITCFILIALYIQYESSYDQHYKNADQTYRVVQQQKGNDFRGSDCFALAPMALVPAMKEQFPEINAATTLQIEEALISKSDDFFYEIGLFADEQLFEVFDYPVLEGEGEPALFDQNAIILTEKMAKKYFGKASAIGQDLLFENDRYLTVRGVIEDPPKNQHFSFDYITSIKNYAWYEDNFGRWVPNNYRAYVTLTEGSNPKVLEDKMGSAFKDELKAAYSSGPFRPQYYFQPLKDIHLHSHINMEIEANSDILYLYIAVAIALIILFLAGINYLNMAIARTTERLREAGLRKVLGAGKTQIILQFLAETTLTTLLSFIMAIGLSFCLLPLFNQLVDLEIPFLYHGKWLFLAGMVVVVVFFGILAGLYPAIVASSTIPVHALKSRWLGRMKDGNMLRKVMVVGQFTAAIVLAISSTVIYKQLRYIQNKKIGFDRKQIMYVPYRQMDIADKMTTIRNELLHHPDIGEVSFACNLPLNMIEQGIAKEWEGNTGDQQLRIYENWVDYNFIELFDIELIEGRNFSRDNPTDSAEAVILNESAVHKLGWTTALGKSFEGRRIIGVAKDFHIQPFNFAIEPLQIQPLSRFISSFGGYIIVKVDNNDTREALAHFQHTLKTALPSVPFDYQYMDNSFNQLYNAEQRYARMIGIFTLLALFIACMGLLGLVTYQVLRRTKEIGIRKVLGASVSSIIGLISADFIKLVLISILVAGPIAWLIGKKWLANFAYRIDLQVRTFLFVGLIALGLAIVTISIQAIRAALMQPVKSLNEE